MAESHRLSNLAARVVEATDLPDGPLLVALSGGADSAALLWLCRRLGRPTRAVHVHHGLAASDRLAGAAVAVAEALETQLTVSRVEIGTGSSPEDMARRARYEGLLEEAGPGDWVLTAHTSDDQAETVIDHLLRSSGTDGLAGIPPRRGQIARPFLGVSRSETREIATLAGLGWVDDPLNESLDPLRNRIRHEVIPYLEERFNRRLRQSLATTARLVAADVAELEARVSAPIEVEGDRCSMPASVLTTVSPARAARAARRLLAAAGLPAASPGAVEGLLAVAAGESEGHEPGASLTVRRRGPLVVVARKEPPEPPAATTLAVSGATEFGGWVFESFLLDRPPVMPLGAAWMVADLDDLDTLEVRPAAAHPELADHLAAGGVAAPERPGHPVVVAGDRPLWVPMVRRLPFGWVDDTTERYLVVRTRGRAACHR